VAVFVREPVLVFSVHVNDRPEVSGMLLVAGIDAAGAPATLIDMPFTGAAVTCTPPSEQVVQ
jgi:hypothetical protein